MAVGLSVNIDSSAKGLTRGFRGAERDIEIFGKTVSGKLAKAFRLGGLGLTAGFAAGAAGITSLIKDIDAANKILVTSTGATGQALRDLEMDVRAVARTVPQGSAEIAGMVGEVNRLFDVSGQAGQELTKLGLDFARLTGVEGASALNSVAGAMKLFGLEAEDTSEVLGDILKASQEYGAESDKLIRGLSEYGPTFSAMGLSIEEVTLVLSQFSRAGVEVSRLGEPLRQFVRNVAKEGGDAREEFLRLIEVFSDGAHTAQEYEQALKLLGSEGINAFVAGARNIDLSAELGLNKDLVADLGEEALTVGDRFQIVGNQIETAFIPLAESMIPVIEGLADATAEFVETWTDEGLTAAINDAKAALDSFLDSKGVGDSGLSRLVGELWSFADAVGDIKDELLSFAADVVGIIPSIDAGDPEDSGLDRWLGMAADAVNAAQFALIDVPMDIGFQTQFAISQQLGKAGLFGRNPYIWQDLQHVTEAIFAAERGLVRAAEQDRERRLRGTPLPQQFDFGGSIAQPFWEAAGILQTPADNLSDSAADLSQAADELKPFDPDTDPSLTAAEVAERYLAGAREGATPGGLQDALVEWMGRQEDFAEGFSQDLENALDDHAQAVEDAAEIARKAGEEFDPDSIEFDFETFVAELDSYWRTQFPGLDLSDDARRMLLQGGLDLDDDRLIAAINNLTVTLGGTPITGGGGAVGVVVAGGATDPNLSGQFGVGGGLPGFRQALISAGIDPATGRPRAVGLPDGLPQGEGAFTPRDEFNLARLGGFFDDQGAFVDVSGQGRTFEEARAGIAAGITGAGGADRLSIRETAEVREVTAQAQRASRQASAAASAAQQSTTAAVAEVQAAGAQIASAGSGGFTIGGEPFPFQDEFGDLYFDLIDRARDSAAAVQNRAGDFVVAGQGDALNPFAAQARAFNVYLPEGSDPNAVFTAQQRAGQTGLTDQAGLLTGNRIREFNP